jgi:NADP-dependent 3-hydroxy acid dehydrogenase YdfG
MKLELGEEQLFFNQINSCVFLYGWMLVEKLMWKYQADGHVVKTIFLLECLSQKSIDMEKLTAKKIVVAGATGGIGRQLVKMLHQSGAEVFVTGRNQSKLDALVSELGLKSTHAFAVEISDESGMQQLGEKVTSVMGTPDILVNLAGVGIIKSMDNLSLAEFNQSLQTNLVGAFLFVKTFLPSMKESKKGLIVNVPGVLGKVPMAGAAAYSASKYGIVGMMQSIREELKRTEIRITNLFLGGVDSPFWDTIDLKVQKDKMIREEEAARSIWFLCQQPASGVVSEMVLQPFNHQAI